MALTINHPQPGDVLTSDVLVAQIAYTGTKHLRGFVVDRRRGCVTWGQAQMVLPNQLWAIFFVGLEAGRYILCVSECLGHALASRHFSISRAPYAAEAAANPDLQRGTGNPSLSWPQTGTTITFVPFMAYGPSPDDMDRHTDGAGKFDHQTMANSSGTFLASNITWMSGSAIFFITFENVPNDTGYTLTVHDEDGDPASANDLTVNRM